MDLIYAFVSPENKLRRSERLRAMGYYNENGKPKTSYRQTQASVTQSRRWRAGTASNSTLANDGDCVTQSLKGRNHTCVDNSGWSNPFVISYHETHIDQSLMAVNPGCFEYDGLSNPTDDKTHINQSLMSGNITDAENITSVDMGKKCNHHLTCFQLFFLMLLAFFFILVVAFGGSELKDVRNDFRSFKTDVQGLRNDLTSLKTDVQDLRNDMDKMKRTLHPEAYSRPDFALDTMKSHIVTDLSSKTHPAMEKLMRYKAQEPWLKFKTPASVIRGQTPPLTPGHCWPFEGESGKLFITLGQEIHVTHVSLGHFSKEQSHMGETLTAPKRFTVYGLKDLNGDETRLGTYEYDDNGDEIQTFEILNHTDEVFKHVKLEVESNYGNPIYTCLYNFKVHGQMQ